MILVFRWANGRNLIKNTQNIGRDSVNLHSINIYNQNFLWANSRQHHPLFQCCPVICNSYYTTEIIEIWFKAVLELKIRTFKSLKVSSNFIYYKTACPNKIKRKTGTKRAELVWNKHAKYVLHMIRFIHWLRDLPTSYEVLQSYMSKIFGRSSFIQIYWDRRQMN